MLTKTTKTFFVTAAIVLAFSSMAYSDHVNIAIAGGDEEVQAFE